MNPHGSSRNAHLSRLARRPILAMVTASRIYEDPTADGTMNDACERLVLAAGRAARAGVDLVQIRERSLEAASLRDLTHRVMRATAATSTRVVVNDRVDVALASGADGVHLPAAAPSCDRVRAIVPDGFLIGRSVHSEAEAVTAEETGGCDYLIFGTVYQSRSKPEGHPVAGVEALGRVCRAVRLPVLAIGGITVERARDVARAGAAGIAAIGLFATGVEAELADTVAQVRQAFDISDAG